MTGKLVLHVSFPFEDEYGMYLEIVYPEYNGVRWRTIKEYIPCDDIVELTRVLHRLARGNWDMEDGCYDSSRNVHTWTFAQQLGASR